MADKQLRPITFEHARIIFRNFSGRPSQYNREGDRNFALVLEDPELIAQMKADGWNVKTRPPREEGDDELNYVSVKVNYKGKPPRVVLKGSRGLTDLSEDLVEMADSVSIDYVDVIIRPYQYDVNGNQGVSAYLQTIFIIINEDDLELKYADEPRAGQGEAPRHDVRFED